MEINNPTPPDRMYTDDGEMIRCKKLNIGFWNMDTSSSRTVSHGLPDITKIISITGIIIRDDNAQVYIFGGKGTFTAGTFPQLSVTYINTVSLSLVRVDGSTFDSNNFDDITMNRGFLFLWYLG